MDNNIFKVKGYYLDDEQKEIVKSMVKNILVIAGAGSGKSLTIVGKIKYLIEVGKVKSNEILCISFTNDSCKSLKSSILKEMGYEIEVLTFHKLALNILKNNSLNYVIAENDLLLYVVNEFINYIFISNDFYKKVVLKYFNINYHCRNIDKLYCDLLINKKRKIELLISNICTFIKLFKSSGKDYNYLKNAFFREKGKLFNKRNVCFLILVIKLLHEYDLELKSSGKVDFDDIISIATVALDSSKYNYKYKYVIIDEFQDTSVARYNLIKVLLDKTNAKFMAVGDDYQSIYRFSGCELGLFLNFEKLFDNSKIYKIQTTYRNSLELIKVCEKFIKVNRSQLDKTLKSNLRLEKPIKILYYIDQKKVFLRLIRHLYENGVRNIMILGRNNNNLNDILSENFKVIEENYIVLNGADDLKIRFFTVHRSKGLEEECVIVISLLDDLWGFPNKKKDGYIFNYVLMGKEKCPYAEERRLFYVALTRTKSYVFLLVDKKKPSIFVNELIRSNFRTVEVMDV